VSWSDEFHVVSGGQTQTQTASANNVNLLWTGNGNLSTAPRLALDFYLKPAITLGGSMGYASASGEFDLGGTSNKVPDSSMWIVAARAGYVIAGDAMSFWLRGGFAYHHATNNVTASLATMGEETGLALTLDPVLVYEILPRIGFILGPFADIGLSGGFTQTGATMSIDRKLSAWGIAAGIFVEI